MYGKCLVLAILATMLLYLGVNKSYSQVPQGQVLGTVSDASGSVAPGASVTLENELTGIKKATQTNASGGYTFSYLNSGSYRVTVELAGFRTALYSGIQVQVAEKKRVDIQLEVGEVSSTITVDAAAALVQTDSATLSNIVSRREVVEMPLNGREFSQLATLMPGVRAAGTTGSFMGKFATNLQIGGTKDRTNVFSLDGVDNTNHFYSGPAMNPSIDSIQEFRVDKNLSQAEFGRGAAHVHVITKTGTNTFHGALWEYHRNYKFSAGDYVTHERNNLLRNQYGANVGGPLVRNRLFFFFNWESNRERDSVQEQASVLTDKMRRGDFSEYPRPIIDPQTGTAFPGNVIPTNRFDPIMMDMVGAMMPRTNRSGITNNYIRNVPLRDDWDQYMGRVDYKLSDNDNIFFRFAYQPRNSLLSSGAAVPGVNVELSFLNTGLGWTRTWNQAVTSETRFSYHREKTFNFHQPLEAIGLRNPSQQINVVHTQVDHLSQFLRTADFSGFGPSGIPFNFDTDNFEVAQNVSLLKGNHLVKAGISAINYDFSYVHGPSKYSWPQVTFQGVYSGSPSADMILGLANTVRGNMAHVLKFLDWKDIGIFAQDDWKVTPSLTLNLGVRYDLQLRVKSKNDTWSSFDLQTHKMVMAGNTVDNPAADPFLVNGYRSLFVAASETSLPIRTLVYGDYNNIAPRFGLAWRPFGNNKTVIRGGYGVFFTRPDGWILSVQQNNIPFGGFINSINPRTNPFTVGNAFSQNLTFPAPNGKYIDPNQRSTYLQQMNLGIQRELPGGFVLEINFQDHNAAKLERNWDVNQPLPGPGSLVSRRPFPQYVSVLGQFHEGRSRYDAAEIVIRKDSKHYTLQWSHTWAKNMADLGIGGLAGNIGSNVISAHDRDAFIGPDFYTPHLDKFHYLIDLPFGKERRWLSQGGPLDSILGGWSISGFAIVHQSGDPLTIRWTGDSANVGEFNVRPNRIGNGKLDNPTAQKWFDTSAFVAPTPITFGNSGTGILYGPSRRFFDVAIHKNFALSETIKLQFRTEMFNAFNHPNLENPQTLANGIRFGEILNKDLVPRVIQFGLKLNF